MGCGCNILTQCEEHKKPLYKCLNCGALFHDHEIKQKQVVDSNCGDSDITYHCPKCDSKDIDLSNY